MRAKPRQRPQTASIEHLTQRLGEVRKKAALSAISSPQLVTARDVQEAGAEALALARDLQLRQPKYNVTAAYCHFGRQPYTKDGLTYFAWEDAKDLSKYAKMSAGDVEKAVASAKAEILTKWVD